jgi:hypothetical protein
MAHREGSRKSKVHALFDSAGAAPAFTLGLKLGLKPSSLHTFFSKWRVEDVQAALAKNAKAKAKAKKAA